MTEKQKSTTNKMRNFLIGGNLSEGNPKQGTYRKEDFEPLTDEYDPLYNEPETMQEEPKGKAAETIERTNEAVWAGDAILGTEAINAIEGLAYDVCGLREVLDRIDSSLPGYMLTREQLRAHTENINKREAELANKKLMSLLEQLSAMREDFLKLSKGMESQLGKFTVEEVFNSFQAYSVDMENMLLDSGVFIGHFEYDRLNTIHQRISDIVLTGDMELNGTIAQRLTEGYKYAGRVLVKEKINVYRYTDQPLKAPEEKVEAAMPEAVVPDQPTGISEERAKATVPETIALDQPVSAPEEKVEAAMPEAAVPDQPVEAPVKKARAKSSTPRAKKAASGAKSRPSTEKIKETIIEKEE